MLCIKFGKRQTENAVLRKKKHAVRAKNGTQTRNDIISLYSLAHFGLYILKQYDNGKFVGGILYDIPKGNTVANIVVKVSDVDNWCINF